MSVYRKVAGVWREVSQPYDQINTTAWRPDTQVYHKVGGTWLEAWPLAPDPVTALTADQVYRNDRQEVDIDWVAPAAGVPVVSYTVTTTLTQKSNGALTVKSYTVNAPTTALTLTGNVAGEGWQKYANTHTLTVSVAPVSSYGSKGVPVSTAAANVSQLPAPPVPSVYTVDVNSAIMDHDVTHVSGNRVTYIEIKVSMTKFVGGVITSSKNVTTTGTTISTTHQPWSPSACPGGDVTAQARAVGPGGASAWVTRTGEVPGPVSLLDVRFKYGALTTNLQNLTHRVNLYYEHWTTGTTLLAQYSTEGVKSAGGTGGIAGGSSTSNSARYRWVAQPINITNGWTNANNNSPWVRKLANPVYIEPENTATKETKGAIWREEVWERQGYAKGSQDIYTNHIAYGFYGGSKFRDAFDSTLIGYEVSVTGCDVLMGRATTGGKQGDFRPRMFLHRSAGKNTGNQDLEGGDDLLLMDRGEVLWQPFRTNWGQYLVDGTNSFRGIAFWHPDTNPVPELGNVSVSFMNLFYSGSTSGGRPFFTVRIYHDG